MHAMYMVPFPTAIVSGVHPSCTRLFGLASWSRRYLTASTFFLERTATERGVSPTQNNQKLKKIKSSYKRINIGSDWFLYDDMLRR